MRHATVMAHRQWLVGARECALEGLDHSDQPNSFFARSSTERCAFVKLVEGILRIRTMLLACRLTSSNLLCG